MNEEITMHTHLTRWEVTFQSLAKYPKSNSSSEANVPSLVYPIADMRITPTAFVVCDGLISQALKKKRSSETDWLELLKTADSMQYPK